AARPAGAAGAGALSAASPHAAPGPHAASAATDARLPAGPHTAGAHAAGPARAAGTGCLGASEAVREHEAAGPGRRAPVLLDAAARRREQRERGTETRREARRDHGQTPSARMGRGPRRSVTKYVRTAKGRAPGRPTMTQGPMGISACPYGPGHSCSRHTGTEL